MAVSGFGMLRFLLAGFIALLCAAGSANATPQEDYAAARAAKENGNVEEAVRLYTQIIDSSDAPDETTRNALNNRGYLFLNEIENYHRAVSDFSVIIRMRPKEIDGYIGRTQALKKLGRFDAALDDLDSAEQLDSTEDFVHAFRGEILAETGRFEAAVESFSKALALEPDNDFYLFGRADAFLKNGQYDEALADLNELVSRKTDVSPVAFMMRWQAYVGKGDFDSALDDLDRLIRAAPDATILRYFRGTVFAQAGKPADAIRDFDECLRVGMEPKELDAAVLLARGEVYQLTGEQEQAVTDFRKALEVAPDNPEVRSKVLELMGGEQPGPT